MLNLCLKRGLRGVYPAAIGSRRLCLADRSPLLDRGIVRCNRRA